MVRVILRWLWSIFYLTGELIIMFDRDSIRGFSALLTLVGVASSLGFSFNAPAFSQATPNNLPLLLAQKSEKVRVAVLDFDYSGLSNPQWLTFLNGGASGVSDILVNKLVESGRYTVIERSRIDAVLREQNFGASGRVDAATAAQIGQILGVDVVIIGSITQFDL